MSVKIFLSTVSDEFRLYRDQLRSDLTRHNVEVKVQEEFKDLGRGTLDELDAYIAHCDAVVHLVGDMAGAVPGNRDVGALLEKYPDLTSNLPPLGEALKNAEGVSYTQWEAWLALYHGRELYIVQAADNAERGPKYDPTVSRLAQSAHLARLRAVKRYPSFKFSNPVDLANHVKSTGILDLLVKAQAKRPSDKEIANQLQSSFSRFDRFLKRYLGDKGLFYPGVISPLRDELHGYSMAGSPVSETFRGKTIEAILDQVISDSDDAKIEIGKQIKGIWTQLVEMDCKDADNDPKRRSELVEKARCKLQKAQRLISEIE